MLCLKADVGGIVILDYKIPVDLLNPAQGTLLTWNQDQSVLQISCYLKSFIPYIYIQALHCEADASETSIILAFPVFTKQHTY